MRGVESPQQRTRNKLIGGNKKNRTHILLFSEMQNSHNDLGMCLLVMFRTRKGTHTGWSYTEMKGFKKKKREKKRKKKKEKKGNWL